MPTIRSHFQPLFQAARNPLSLSIYFTVMVLTLSLTLSATIRAGLEKNDVSAETVNEVSSLPPTGALFAVFLSYNPMQTLLPEPVLNQLAPAECENLLSTTFFPSTISDSFIGALRSVFLFTARLTLTAVFSALHGRRYVHAETTDAPPSADFAYADSGHWSRPTNIPTYFPQTASW